MCYLPISHLVAVSVVRLTVYRCAYDQVTFVSLNGPKHKRSGTDGQVHQEEAKGASFKSKDKVISY